MDQTPSLSNQVPIIKKKNSSYIVIILIILIIVMFVLIGGGIYWLTTRNKLNTLTQNSSDNLPVMSISGVIERIDGNTISLSANVFEQNNLKFSVSVDDKTEMIIEKTFVPMDIPDSTPAAETTATIADLKVGRFITVFAPTDLQKTKSFTASKIIASAGVTNVTAEIVEVSDAFITVHVTPPSIAEAKDVAFQIDDLTQIKNAQQNNINVGQLKPRNIISLYTDRDIHEQNVKALRIEVQ